jgi:hypothetical protein
MRPMSRFRGLIARYPAESTVFAGAFLLLAPGLFWGMPSEFPSEIDSILPMGPIHFFLNYTGSHDQLSYPAFHYVILAGVYAVCFALFKVTGMLGAPVAAYPFGLHDPLAAISLLIVAGRTVTALMGAGICAVLFRTVRTMTDRTTALFMTLSLLSSAVFVYYSRVSNLDIPECFWWLLSYALFLQAIYGVPLPTVRAMVMSGMFGGFAVATKDQAMMFIIPQCLLLLIDGGKERFRARCRKAVLYTSIVIAAYVLAAIVPQPVRWVHHLRFIFTNQGQYRIFGFTPHDQILLLWTVVRNLFVTASPLAVLGVAGIGLLIARRTAAGAAPLVIPLLFFYVFMMVPVGFAYERFMLNAAIIVLIPAGYVFHEIGRRCTGQKGRLVFLLCTGMVVAAEFSAGYVPLTIAMTGDAKRKLTAVLVRTVPAGSRILLHASYFSLPNAAAYRTFAFCSQDKWASIGSKRLAGLIDHDTTGTTFVLADHDLRNPIALRKGERIDTASLTLLETVRFPRWVEHGAMVYRASHAAGVFFVAQSYYLYARRGSTRL